MTLFQGLEWSAKEDDIRMFLVNCNIDNVVILTNKDGRSRGEALVKLASTDDTVRAKKHHKQYLGRRFVVIEEILEEQYLLETMDDVAMEKLEIDPPTVAKKQKLEFDENVVRITNVPDDTNEGDLFAFLGNREAMPENIYINRKEDGKISEVFAESAQEGWAVRALACQNSFFRGRRLNVDRSKSKPELFKKIQECQNNCQEHETRRKVLTDVANLVERESIEIPVDDIIQCSPNKSTKSRIKREVSINLGPKWDRWNLRNIENVFESNPEWKEMQTFWSLPTYEKRMTDHEIEENMKNFQILYEEERKKNPEVACNRIKDNKDYKRFEEKLTSKAEIDLKNFLVSALKGQRGLLVRSLEFKKIASIENYKAMKTLGLDIPAFSCSNVDDSHEHSLGCYQSESDIVIIYPAKSTLCIRIIEVKRQFHATWAPNLTPHRRLTEKCLEQLLKAVKFLISLIPDIHSENIDIKLFTAFPEADCSNIFCEECKRFVFDKSDFKLTREQIFAKLLLGENSQEANPDNRFVLKLTSRLIGLFSLLHRQNTTLADYHKRETDEVNNTEERYRQHWNRESYDGFIFLNDVQRDILSRPFEGLNVCFTGASGTGKTEMALALVKNIAIDCQEKGEHIKIVIATCIKGKTAPLITKFKRDFEELGINEESSMIYPTGELCKLLGFSLKEYQEGDRYNKWPDIVNRISEELSRKFPNDKIIFFVDEIMPFGNRAALDWSNTQSRHSMNIFLAFSPLGQDRKRVLKITDQAIQLFPQPNEEYFVLPDPNTSGFVHCPLTLRYRSTQCLQNFTKLVGKHVGKYAETNERPGIDAPGEKVRWLDLGCLPDVTKVKEAVLTVKAEILKRGIKKEDIVVLHDRDINDNQVKAAQDVLTNHGNWKSLEVLEERLFHGCERNTVVYLGAGHMEAFTRPLVHLFVITWTENHANPWYKAYHDALNDALTEGYVEKLQ